MPVVTSCVITAEPVKFGAETSSVETSRVLGSFATCTYRNVLVPKRLGAETSRSRNGLVPKRPVIQQKADVLTYFASYRLHYSQLFERTWTSVGVHRPVKTNQTTN